MQWSISQLSLEHKAASHDNLQKNDKLWGADESWRETLEHVLFGFYYSSGRHLV